jgi:preprotein translocase subunit SecD
MNHLLRASACLAALLCLAVAISGCGRPDYSGGTELVYEIQATGKTAPRGLRDEVMAVIDYRLHFAHCRVLPGDSPETLRVQVPRSETDRINEIEKHLNATGRLDFKLAMPRGDPTFGDEYGAAERGETVNGCEKMHLDGDPAKPFYPVREGEAEITGRLLADVDLTRDQVGRPAIGFEFNNAGSAQFASITERNRGWALAIILDGKLMSAPIIRSRVAGEGIIEGDFTEAEAQRIVRVLYSGSFPAPVKLVEKRTITAAR